MIYAASSCGHPLAKAKFILVWCKASDAPDAPSEYIITANPDIVDLFHTVQERLATYSDRELQAIADGLSFVFGRMSV